MGGFESTSASVKKIQSIASSEEILCKGFDAKSEALISQCIANNPNAKV